MPKKSGFTLVELLIVITIIAVLAAVGLVSYIAFLKNARDAKRQSDIKFIQSALEQYFADQKHYPPSVKPDESIAFGGRTYLTKVPSDPLGSPNYSYVGKPDGCTTCTNYCLFAKIEATNPSDDSGCTPLDPYNYGVAKP